MKIIFLGVVAALFFSATFVFNRAMSLEGGHWFWSAALRYGWMVTMIVSWLFLAGKRSLLSQALSLYRRHFLFWTISGSIGFGVFYAGICFSAAYAPGWVVAATWQTTILATPLVLLCFGRKVPLSAMLLTSIIFAGVLVINAEQASAVSMNEVLLGALPVVIAAFAYPFGNQMVWEAREGTLWRVPALRQPAMDSSLCRILLMTLGSIPFWLLLAVFVQPGPPAQGQWLMTGLVALFSGVIATGLFFKARHQARTSAQLAAADSTQSMEVVFSLVGEVLLLGGILPGLRGWSGIVLTMLGLVLYLRVQRQS